MICAWCVDWLKGIIGPLAAAAVHRAVVVELGDRDGALHASVGRLLSAQAGGIGVELAAMKRRLAVLENKAAAHAPARARRPR